MTMAPKAEKKGFLIYTDNTPWVDMLTDEECGQLLKLLLRYARETVETGERPLPFLMRTQAQLSDATKLAFGFMGDSIWRDTEKWKKSKKTREENFSAAAYFNEEKFPAGQFDDRSGKNFYTVVTDIPAEPVPIRDI